MGCGASAAGGQAVAPNTAWKCDDGASHESQCHHRPVAVPVVQVTPAQVVPTDVPMGVPVNPADVQPSGGDVGGLRPFLLGLGVREPDKAIAVMQGAGIHTAQDFNILDKDMRDELDEEFKKGGVSIGDRAKIKKAEKASVQVSQGNGKINVTMMNVGDGMQLASQLERVFLGLGWKEKQGFGKVDVDASALVFSNGHLQDSVSFQNLRNPTQSMVHTGDVLSGAEQNGKPLPDMERIYVRLSNLLPGADCISFVASIYTDGQDFTALSEAYIRLVNADTNQELCRLCLAGKGLKGNAVVFSKLYRYGGRPDGSWQVLSLGQPMDVPGHSAADQLVPHLAPTGGSLPLKPSSAPPPAAKPTAATSTPIPVGVPMQQAVPFHGTATPAGKPQRPLSMYVCPALAVATAGGVAAATAIFLAPSLDLGMLTPSIFESGVDFSSLVPTGDMLEGLPDLLPTDAFESAYDWASGVTESVNFDGAIEAVADAGGAAVDGLGEAGQAIGDFAGDAAEGLGDAGQAVGDFAGDAVEGLGDAGQVMGDFAGDAAEGFGEAGEAIGGFAGDAMEATPDMFATVGDGMEEAGGAMAGIVGDAPDAFASVGGYMGDVVEAAPDAFEAAGGFVGDGFEAAGDFVPGAAEALGDAFGGMGGMMPGAVDAMGDAFGDMGAMIEGADIGAIMEDAGQLVENAGDILGGLGSLFG